MKKEDLYNAINALDEEMLAKSEQYRPVKIKWRALGSIAAAFILIAGVAIMAGIIRDSVDNVSKDIAVNDTSNSISDSSQADDAAMNEPSGEYGEASESIAYEGENSTADIESLLANRDNKDEALCCTTISYGKYEIEYHKAEAVSEELLNESIGTKVEGCDKWYRLKGHDEMHYLINLTDDETSIWEFAFFISNEYPYSDVLSLIYGISSAGDISMITATAGNMDNTDAGKELQQQIGTTNITDRTDIEAFYNIISAMTCCGSNNWDKIDYGSSDDGMLDAVRNSRYFTLTCNNGNCITSLKYTKISGMFYEYNGVAYNRLKKPECITIEDMFDIK